MNRENWKTVKVHDVCEFVRNGASIKQDPLCKSGIPITRIETLSNNVFNYDRLGYANITDEKYSDYYLKDKDVLLSHINSAKYLGRSVLFQKTNEDPIIHGMNLLCLRFIQDDYYPPFFVYYVQSNLAKSYIGNNTKLAVNQASITATAIKEMPIPLPTLDVQKQIALNLDQVTKVIAEYKELLAKYDLLIKSRFIEMFGDPVTNPMGWEVKQIQEVAPAKQSSKILEDKVWLLNLDMIESQTGRIIDYLYVDKDEIGNSTYIFDTNNVLYSKLRPYLNKVVIPTKYGVCTSELVPLYPTNELNRYFLAELLRTNSFVSFINEKVAGAKMPRVSMDVFRKFECILPPLELQQQFADFVQQIDKSKLVVQQSLEKAETLYKSLMQEYFG